MTEFARVVTFHGDDAALDALISQIDSQNGPPPGVPATRITLLADRTAGKLLVALRFGSEADLRAGAATLEAMSPSGPGTIRRTAVDVYEVALEKDAT